jgi:hypothetical protein
MFLTPAIIAAMIGEMRRGLRNTRLAVVDAISKCTAYGELGRQVVQRISYLNIQQTIFGVNSLLPRSLLLSLPSSARLMGM